MMKYYPVIRDIIKTSVCFITGVIAVDSGYDIIQITNRNSGPRSHEHFIIMGMGGIMCLAGLGMITKSREQYRLSRQAYLFLRARFR